MEELREVLINFINKSFDFYNNATYNNIVIIEKNKLRADNKLTFLIYGFPYTTISSGVRVLHKLGEELTKLGENVIIYSPYPKPGSIAKYITNLNKARGFVQRYNPIIIYPEFPDIPLRGKRIVRYILCYPRFNDPTRRSVQWLSNELEVCHTHLFVAQPTPQLFIPTIELNIFNNDNNNESRTLTGYYLGRPFNLSREIIDRHKHLIDKCDYRITSDWPSTREEIAKLFRKTKLFISFDNITALYREASLCGCLTLLIPNGSVFRERIEYEMGLAGVAWGEDDLARAERTLPNAMKRYLEFLDKTKNDTKDFVALCKEYFC